MKLCGVVAALLLLAGNVFAQDYTPVNGNQSEQVKTAEVFRRGDYVEHMGVTRSAEDELYLAAVSTPADDSNKWYITVLTMPNCRYCDELIRGFQTTKPLQAFANPTDKKASWSHFNVYDSTDETQKFRFKNVAVKGYPTLIVQPPMNGKFGPPTTIVMQKTGYNGKPEQLAKQLSEQIKKYVATVKPKVSGPTLAPSPNPIIAKAPLKSVVKKSEYPRTYSNAEAGGYKGLWGEDPKGGILTPFKPKPKVDPPLVTPSPDLTPTPDLNIPSPVDPDATPVVIPTDPNAPPTGPPNAKPDTKTIVVVFDSEQGLTQATDTKLTQRLAELKVKYKDHVVKYMDYQLEGKAKFPTLSKVQLPAIQVVDASGNTVEATTPPIENEFPWASVLAFFMSGMTNPVALAPLATWALVFFYNRRKANKKKQLLNDTTVLAVKNFLSGLFGGTPATPAPSNPTPSNGIDLNAILNSPIAQQVLKMIQEALANKQPVK
jgi:hypothetical protein